MDKILKYELSNSKTTLELPLNTQVLSVQKQGHSFMLWARVPEQQTVMERNFEVFGTGDEVPPKSLHCGTIQDEMYVWHVFELFK